jgi:tetraacyldisaccharide 4'-kinase
MIGRLLLPFSEGYRAGIALRHLAYRYGLFKTRRLNRPVISVGNLTVGGTGKTPLVMFIAERLLDRGWTPSILTRGYRRTVGGMFTIAPQTNRRADPRQAGDEASLLAAALPKVPIVVSGNRHRAGRMAEERFTVDVHLLDDGFQHWALERSVDIVTIDVTQDFSAGILLPAGRFREPRSALRRADIVVLTRTELADGSSHREIVARLNPRAAIFESTISLRGWIDAQSGSPVSPSEMQGRRALAFCGIGNPKAFFASLREWGVQVSTEVAYRDHYQYGRGDLHRLERRARAASAEMMLTTEKDLANFPSEWRLDIPVIASVARLEMQNADAFVDSLISRVHSLRVAG